MTRQSLVLEVDLAHGGRWTSLRTSDREWLWANPSATTQRSRRAVRPGHAFVDAGGVEECFPTLRGTPDHGDVWSRPWRGTRERSEVEAAGLRLRRVIESVAGSVVVRYEVEGAPGTPFVHAVHALLDVSPEARIEIEGCPTVEVLDSDEPVRPWPSGLQRLGPDDGTAVCAVVRDCSEAMVVDGDEALLLAWSSPAQPAMCSLVLWRNLGGWPVDGPYRSIGVEPMLGRAADHAAALPCLARLGEDGRAAWDLTISAVAGSGATVRDRAQLAAVHPSHL